MGFFAPLSIQQKFRTLMVTISFAGLLVAVIAFFITDIWHMKANMIKDVYALAEVIGKDVSVALAFDDAFAAADTLSALKKQPQVLSACIYDIQKKVFADFHNPAIASSPCTYQAQTQSWRFAERDMDIHHPIMMDGERLGTLVIRYSLAPIAKRLRQYAWISLIILALSISIVFVFSFVIERIFLAPIMNLKNTAENISLHGDHTIRAHKENPDEIGVLVDSFNRMLDVIQNHENEQERYKESLEQTVAARTTELQLRNQEVEETNRKLEDAVRHAEAMAAEAESANAYKSQFLANMSHEIRTPLNAILGFSDLLRSKKLRKEQQNDYLGTIAAAGNTLLSLINDILDLSKIEAGKLDLDCAFINLRDSLRSIERMFSQQVRKKGLAFLLEVDPHLPAGLLLDEHRLRQVLVNLVGNAIKFTEKGHIGLAVRVLSRIDPHCGDIEVRIWDSGMGIAEDQQAAVFESFQQQQGQELKYGGTGLGLAISQRLVKLMKGEISVRSAMGKGTTFTLVLRRVAFTQKPPSRFAAEANAIAAIEFDSATVVIADDVPTNRILIKEYLKGQRLDLLEAGDGRAALEIAKSRNIDLLLLDLKMPQMDGYQTASAFKADPTLAAIPIVAVTASIPVKQVGVLNEAGFDGYLLKPVNQNQLLAELMRFLTFRHIEAPQRSDAITARQKASKNTGTYMHEGLMDASPELLERLAEILQGRLKAVRRTMLNTDLRDLAEKVGIIGRQYKAEWLNKWSNCMQEHVNNFDVEGMLSELDHFAQIEEKINSIYGEKS